MQTELTLQEKLKDLRMEQQADTGTACRADKTVPIGAWKL